MWAFVCIPTCTMHKYLSIFRSMLHAVWKQNSTSALCNAFFGMAVCTYYVWMSVCSTRYLCMKNEGKARGERAIMLCKRRCGTPEEFSSIISISFCSSYQLLEVFRCLRNDFAIKSYFDSACVGFISNLRWVTCKVRCIRWRSSYTYAASESWEKSLRAHGWDLSPQQMNVGNAYMRDIEYKYFCT
jgi:hypothetical protein